MNKTLLILLLLSQAPGILHGQDEIRLYYNSNWEITKKDSSAFYRKAHYDLNNFKLNGRVMDYFPDSTLLMEGHYSFGKREGLFLFYFKNGNIRSKGEYANSHRIGRWEYYYSNGDLKQIIEFTEIDNKTDFSVLEFYDRSRRQLIKAGTGKWINDSIRTGMFDKKSLKKLTGQFKNGEKTGSWKLMRLRDKKIMFTEHFHNGNFIDATVYNPHGDYEGTIRSEILNKMPDENAFKLGQTENFKLDSLFFPQSLIYSDVETIFKTVSGKEIKIKNRPAGYAYGDYSLMAFIQQNIKYPANAAINNQKGTVYLKIVIDPYGHTKEISVIRGVNEDLNNEAIRVVKLIKDWMPALLDGVAIESSIGIPVRFDIK
ncbi:MAG: TonB family protein [Bacteroidales bacterium]|nr:TonB family protein [Bacteroidales bacterium]